MTNAIHPTWTVFLSDPPDDPMGEIRVTVKLIHIGDQERARLGEIPADQVRSVTVEGVVDTGAVQTVLPQSVVDELGIGIREMRRAEYADGRREIVGATNGFQIEIMGRTAIEDALVLGDTVLIGQTVLEKTDLLADCTNRRLIPNPDHPDGPVMMVR